MRRILYIGLCLLALSCSKDSNPQINVSSEVLLVEQLKAFPQLDRFREAVQACEINMGESFNDLSIFAPTNAEMNRLLAEFEVNDFESLKSQMGKKFYRAWLASHFLPSAAKVENLRTSYVATLAINGHGNAIHHHLVREKSIVEINGQRLNIQSKDHGIDAGYLHIINGSLKPATLFKHVNSNNHSFSILQRALQGPANSVASLLNRDSESYTLFAPNDQAFDHFFREENCSDLSDFVAKKGKKALIDLLRAHIVQGAYDLNQLDGVSHESLLKGSFIQFQLKNGNIELKRSSATAMGPFPKASVYSGNVYGFNGTLHTLNNVLKLN